TVTLTLEVEVAPEPSPQVSAMSYAVPRTLDAVKVGWAVSGLVSTGSGPAGTTDFATQLYVSGSPWESDDAVPSRVTSAPGNTDFFAPAFAVGTGFATATVTLLAVALNSSGSFTCSWNT